MLFDVFCTNLAVYVYVASAWFFPESPLVTCHLFIAHDLFFMTFFCGRVSLRGWISGVPDDMLAI